MAKILVVEDEDTLRQEVMDWLSFEGYDVCGAPNGRIGLEMSRSDLPDVIVSDIAMPEMNGFDLLLSVRLEPRLAQIPFIFLTAAADHAAMRRGMALGADDYVTKPFTNEELLNAIQMRLQKRDAQERLVQEQVALLSAALSEEREKRLFTSRLSAMISHDFRTPLTTILSSADIIKLYEDRLSPERKRQYLDRIDGSVRMLLHMLDDLLMVATIESGHLELVPESINLSTFIDAIVEEFRLIDNNLHRITLDDQCKCYLYADPRFIRQLIINLISNALKYSPHGTTVLIRLKVKAPDVELMVEDHGIGVPADALPHLFEPFYRAENAKGYKGVGLGLPIIKQAVELHGGSISIESEINHGTRFTVRLPLDIRTAMSAGVMDRSGGA